MTKAAPPDTASTSAAVERAVVKRPTNVEVTSSSPTKFGESVTFTASVTSGGTTVTGGTIRFLAGAEQVQATTAVDANGQVTFTTSALPVGDTTVTAEYSGTAVYADASGNRVHSVDTTETTTTVKISAAALTATVRAVAPGGGTPNGTVTFSVGDKPVGEAALVDGVATLAASLATGKPIDVHAAYSGSSNHLTSAAVTRRTDPAITARVQSSRAKSARGWYRTPVVVTFSCAAGSAPLTQPCPKPVKVTRSARAIPVVGTATATDGGAAKVKVTVNIDRKAPSLRVKRTGNRLRCQAKDTLSGIASCKITKKNRAEGVVTWVAKAKDRAGNVTTKRGKFTKR
ncbi:Ig-like domain-containing protein [Aeromicrobium sp. UC242_57]|uniref:Ig-like domain-containing protein n=1 Tax=Aeromicrobium sp. UC242_57 TaxID=3374624 RepID=UPI0037BD3F8F